MAYTSDWFSTNIARWQKHLGKFAGNPCTALELGTYEGRSAVWLLENILTHPKSAIHCVDSARRPNLIENLAPFDGRYTFDMADATDFLMHAEGYRYDIAYVDADHTAKDVIMQAGLIWPIMKEGGILIFDDNDNPRFTVKAAVDFFLQHWKGHAVLCLGHQAMIQKL